VSKKTVDQSCTSDCQCVVGVSLVCSNNTCQCSSNALFWAGQNCCIIFGFLYAFNKSFIFKKFLKKCTKSGKTTIQHLLPLWFSMSKSFRMPFKLLQVRIYLLNWSKCDCFKTTVELIWIISLQILNYLIV
jgi:hypothetical protein